MQSRITSRSVDKLRPGEILTDDRQPGLVVRKLPSGRATFGYRFSIDGRRHWLALGVGIAAADARKAAQAHAGRVALGQCPVSERAVRLEKTRAERSLNDVLDAYIKDRVLGLRSAGEVVSLIDRLVRPKLGKRPIDGLRRLEIVELLDAIADAQGARTSDKTLSLMRSCFDWHSRRDDNFRSPIVRGMNKLSVKDLIRDRILDDSEIQALWSALDAHPHQPYAKLVRCLLLTATRRAEMGRLRWCEIKGDVAVIPASRTKTAVDHSVPLTPQVAALIGKPGEAGDFVFSISNGIAPYSNYAIGKAKLDVAVNEQRARDGLPAMAPWRLHDLRRTGRTLLSRAGISSDIAERVLGHKMPTIRGTYDRHDYVAEKRDALQRLQALVADIVTGNGKHKGRF